ncbi:MAG: AAA family ATPase [Gammaproteobacteria bacterium]|nr:MAG: AAA family ATPase [Gammaproteobacteria bacterium]
MKINKISSFGNVAVRNAEINLRAPIALICGSNRAGKTSLRNGIIHALTGKTDTVSLKKDWPLLINKHDNNLIGYTLVNFDDDKTACINLHNGVHELKTPLHSALPYVLNPSLFGSITPDERRSLLFDLGNLRSDGSEVKQKLLDRGCDPAKVDQVLPFLKSSFDSAAKHAEENVKQARANWKAVTGEIYGDKKAEGWKAPQPPAIDNVSKEEVSDYLLKIDAELDAANQELGKLQAQFNGAAARNAEIVRLRTEHEKFDRIRTKLDKDRQEVAMWMVKVDDTRLIANGSKPGAISCSCPSCGTELVFDGEKLIERGGDLHGDEDAAMNLKTYEATLELLKKSVASGERDLVTATAAGERIAVMEAENKSAPDEQALVALKANIEVMKTSRKDAKTKLDEIERNVRLASEAEAKTKKAAEHHVSLQEWDKIASALAPNGIPSEMLSASLDPINKRITESVKRLGFYGDVFITPDMTILEDDCKLYSLSSKATRLLIDSMIAEAISHVSGIKFFMVDEFDLLDMQSRSNYLNWLIELAEKNEIDTAIIFGTLKQPPKLPPQFSVHWLQDGVIAGHVAEVAA